LTIRTALLQGIELLQNANIDAPRLTAEVLLGHAAGGRRREWLYAHGDDELIELWWIHYGRYLHERIAGKPTQYITRKQEFYGRDFRVTPDVLIPRPETEHLIEAALTHIQTPLVDVGAGSGAIAVTLSLEARIPTVAVDISRAALGVAAANANALGADVHFVEGDLLTAFANRSLGTVVSNPPYIAGSDRETLQREVREHEPHLALFSGDGGIEHYRRIVEDAERVLKPGGWLVMELGYDSAPRVRALLTPRWKDIELVNDLAGYPRVIAAKL
jgi:release factor glutamine methyltransferase